MSQGSIYATCPYCRSRVLISELIQTAGSSFSSEISAIFTIRGASLVKYTGSGQTPVIPSGIRKIEAEAFQRTAITAIQIPEGVVEIGSYAFDDCSELASVVLPSTIRKIGNRAFRRCYNLRSFECRANWAMVEKGEDILIGCPCDSQANGRLSHEIIDSLYDEMIESERMQKGLCTYCGGRFKLFQRICSVCGKPKNY